MQEVNIAILLLALAGVFYGSWLLAKGRQKVEAKLSVIQIRDLEVVRAAATFWREALCRDFYRPLLDNEEKTFYEVLRTEIARSYGVNSVIANLGMCCRRSCGYVSRLAADGYFTASEEGLREMLHQRITIDFYLPLVEMRIWENKIKIRPVSGTEPSKEWQLIFEVGKTNIEEVAEIGRQFRQEKAWTEDQLAV